MSEKSGIKKYLEYLPAGIIFIFILAVVPLIVKAISVDVTEYEYGFIRSSKQITDIFSYYKSVFFCIATAFAFFIFLIYFFDDKGKATIKNNKIIIILSGIYILFAILSSLFSDYKSIAFGGISERYESIWVLISYTVIMLCAMLYIESEKPLRIIVFGVFLGVLFVGGIGLFQYFGMDIFSTDFAAKLVIGDAYKEGQSLNIKFTDVYSTLYNPNCVGMYSAMMFPFMFVLTVLLPIRDFFKYIALGLMGVSFINLIGSNSTGGIVGVVAAFSMVGLVFIIKLIYNKKFKALAVIFGAFAILILGSAITLMNNFAPQINQKLNELPTMVEDFIAPKSPYLFRDFKIFDDRIEISTPYDVFTFKYNEAKTNVELTDKEKNVLVPFERLDITTEEKVAYKVKTRNIGEVQVIKSRNYIAFKKDNVTFVSEAADGRFYAINKDYKRIDFNEKVKSFGFEGREFFGSGRGYIWSRSMPLILDNVILGSGSDTFALEFPQLDVEGKTKFLGNPFMIVDKPHSMYLQIAINTGLISLIAVLGIFLLYIIQSIISIIKHNENKFVFAVKFALFAGIIGYLVSALATDSVVSVAPTFWIMLGTGIALNRL